MVRKSPYFYLNDQLHKRLGINRGKDWLYAWNYPERKRQIYTYSDAIRRMAPAFSTAEVAKMVNRKKNTIERLIWQGHISTPQHIYSLKQGIDGAYMKYMWNEQDMMGLLDYLGGLHFGRPRKDGMIVPLPLPTPRELRAMIHDEDVLYVKQGEQYVPSWRAKEF